ncbi:hypothetical protein ACIQBJ_20445 [Kitasatospora sp. NPDC088391]|uniref:hypothetical protein n=1 Tax=Kitasatospora sp. NPDC088391 TaxID=3364074 RepID=UPI00381139F1
MRTLLDSFLAEMDRIQADFQTRMEGIDRPEPPSPSSPSSPPEPEPVGGAFAAQPEGIEDRIGELRHLLGLEAIWNGKREAARGVLRDGALLDEVLRDGAVREGSAEERAEELFVAAFGELPPGPDAEQVEARTCRNVPALTVRHPRAVHHHALSGGSLVPGARAETIL